MEHTCQQRSISNDKCYVTENNTYAIATGERAILKYLKEKQQYMEYFAANISF